MSDQPTGKYHISKLRNGRAESPPSNDNAYTIGKQVFDVAAITTSVRVQSVYLGASSFFIFRTGRIFPSVHGGSTMSQIVGLTNDQPRRPPGPTEQYSTSEELFLWLNRNFARYGDIYKTSIHGSEVYVVSAPEYCEHILRRNWRNYLRHGQVVKRIALLLGNGLISSNGEFWASQRRMIQPAFSKNSIAGLIGVITRVNAELLEKWKLAAKRRESVNVTHDISLMVLKFTLTAIFGDDYTTVAPHFNLLAEESARNFEFAQAFRPLATTIIEIAAKRRRDNTTTVDFLGKLVQARDRARGEPMPDVQLAREVLTLLVAGHETTSALLNWLWYLLSRYPEAQTKLSEEFDRVPWGEFPATDMLPNYPYTRWLIDEALRLYPPLWLMTRKAINDDQLGTFFVPAGTEIYISPYLIQRNPNLWEAPDRFDPHRMSLSIDLNWHCARLAPAHGTASVSYSLASRFRCI
jgi:cytochrome P450